MKIECGCNTCGKIQFEPGRAGETVTCPHCGIETVLFNPQRDEPAPMPAPKIALPTHQIQEPKKSIVGRLPTLVLAVTGIGLMLSGCAGEFDSKSAMQQTVATIQYCTGLLVVGLSFVLDALRTLSKNQKP